MKDLKQQIEQLKQKAHEEVDKAFIPIEKLLMTLCEDKPDYVEINGIKWDKENTVYKGHAYFQFDEAQDIAKLLGKRLPTEQEFCDLVVTGKTYDDERCGWWFGHDSDLKEESKKSVFFQNTGFENFDRNYDKPKECKLNGRILSSSNGYYWSSSASSSAYGRYLYFNSGNVYPSSYYNRALGFAVRCVLE